MRAKLGSVLLLAIAMVLPAAAQTTDQRVKAIWGVAANRMITQQDAWFDDGDYLACINLLGFESEKYHNDYEMWTNLGWMQENVHDWDGALATYQRYRKLNEGEVDNSLPEAQYYFMKKQYALIPDLLESAIKHPKCHPNNFRLLAWSYERMKKYPEAVRVWKAYLATGANDATAKRNLGRDEQRVSTASR
jgi:tetratricopeptide (TPR) repeat protein